MPMLMRATLFYLQSLTKSGCHDCNNDTGLKPDLHLAHTHTRQNTVYDTMQKQQNNFFLHIRCQCTYFLVHQTK